MQLNPNNVPYEEIPPLIRVMALFCMSGTPLSPRVIAQAQEQHPEHFVEELDNKRRFDAIPVEVHRRYAELSWRLRGICLHGITQQGLYEKLDNPGRYQLYLAKKKTREPYYQLALPLLHARAYAGYDFPYDAYFNRLF